MKTIFSVLAVTAVLVLFSGCAPGPNAVSTLTSVVGEQAGFWKGLWHGFIILFTFVISLFSDSVSIYEVQNNGGWYNFGYLLGVMIFFGGGGGGACKSTCRD